MQWGFRLTQSYVGNDGNDYTRGRSYGRCGSPLFRDHGRVATGKASIQYVEPNPEVLNYFPPYWNWPAYVYWWHRTY
jgi:hypothetical protein